METLMNMPIADRKFYIAMHNRSENGNENGREAPSEETEKMNMMRNVKDWH